VNAHSPHRHAPWLHGVREQCCWCPTALGQSVPLFGTGIKLPRGVRKPLQEACAADLGPECVERVYSDCGRGWRTASVLQIKLPPPQLKPSKVRMSGFLTPFTVLEARQHISERMSHVTSVLSLVACRESGVNSNAFQSQAHKHCIRLCLTVDLQAVRNLRHLWASHSFADR